MRNKIKNAWFPLQFYSKMCQVLCFIFIFSHLCKLKSIYFQGPPRPPTGYGGYYGGYPGPGGYPPGGPGDRGPAPPGQRPGYPPQVLSSFIS